MLQKKIYRSICVLTVLTLFLIMCFLLPACYSILNKQLKENVALEAEVVSKTISESKSFEAVKDISSEERYVIFKSFDGDVLYESGDKKSVNETTVIMQKVPMVGEFTIAATNYAMSKIFLILFLPSIFIAVMIYLLIHLIAMGISENIVKPITNINFNTTQDDIYGELKPFISKIKSQNTEITKQINRLKTQKSRLGTISESMNEGLVVFDDKGTVLSINQSALKIFTAKGDSSVVGKVFSEFCDDTQFTDSIEISLKGRKYFFEYGFEDSTYQVFCSPVFEKESISGVVMLIFDISEKQRAEKIRREFSANVSHELKTPLTTVLGYSELIASGIAKEEDVKGFAEKISHESSRLIGLIEDIIKLSKLDEQGLVEESEPVDIYKTACEVIAELTPHAKKNNISLYLNGTETMVEGNPSQLYELIYNLCDNAIKYNNKNGVVKVTVKNKVVSVEDTGIGISQNDVGRIFERFYRVDKSRSKAVSGTGLGLSIVKHIALSHDAQIDVESTLGKGTKIQVMF